MFKNINISATAYLRYFGFTKIPLLFYIRPSVVRLNKQYVIVKVPLRRRTQNHLKSMYFGVLAAGADCAAGLIAMETIRKSGKKIALIFKDMSASFLKRAEGDVHFYCDQGDEIRSLVERAIQTGERVEQSIKIIATVPSISDDVVAEFKLTLSLKEKTAV